MIGRNDRSLSPARQVAAADAEAVEQVLAKSAIAHYYQAKKSATHGRHQEGRRRPYCLAHAPGQGQFGVAHWRMGAFMLLSRPLEQTSGTRRRQFGSFARRRPTLSGGAAFALRAEARNSQVASCATCYLLLATGNLQLAGREVATCNVRRARRRVRMPAGAGRWRVITKTRSAALVRMAQLAAASSAGWAAKMDASAETEGQPAGGGRHRTSSFGLAHANCAPCQRWAACTGDAGARRGAAPFRQARVNMELGTLHMVAPGRLGEPAPR